MLLAVILLSFSATCYAQTEHVIVLQVNTANIEKQNVEAYCNFEGQNPEIAPRDFTTFVQNGDIIRWIGVSTSSENDVVNITSINYQGGKNLLGVNILRGNGVEVSGTVQNGAVDEEDGHHQQSRVRQASDRGEEGGERPHAEGRLREHGLQGHQGAQESPTQQPNTAPA